MGPVEEVGRTTRDIVGSLSQSPTILAFSVFNILFLGFVLYSTIEEREWRERVVIMMVEQQSASAKLLFSCVPYDQIGNLIKAFKEDINSPDDKKK